MLIWIFYTCKPVKATFEAAVFNTMEMREGTQEKFFEMAHVSSGIQHISCKRGFIAQ